MTVKTFTVGNMDNKCYLVTDDNSGDMALVDASFAHKSFVEEISSLKDKLKYIFLTHGHYDHILSAKAIKDATGAKVVIHKKDAICLSSPAFSLAANHALSQQPLSADIICDDGDEIALGSLTFKVIYTPGHTVGSVCYECGDALFTGDTLFRLGVGRTDLPTGNTAKTSAGIPARRQHGRCKCRWPRPTATGRRPHNRIPSPPRVSPFG